MKTATLRPGILVALKTIVEGGINYTRIDLDRDHVTGEGTRKARWETTRVIENPEEYEKAVQLRGKARSLISAACSNSSFGLLCPVAKEAELDKAIAEARVLAGEFNATAEHSTVLLYVLKGRIAENDAEALKAINSEVRELIDAMNDGIKSADVPAIREAANKARQLGAMLTDDAGRKVADAIEQARSAARTLVKRVEKGGELAATVVAELKVEALEGARFAFLDMEEGERVEVPAEARSLDLRAEVES